MALINCPECNKEVSDTAAACPHCGYNVAEYIGKQAAEQQREMYLAQQASDVAARQEKRATRRKMSIKKKVVIAVCSVVVLAAIGVGLFPTWYSLFTGRDTFYSKKAMLEYLEGEWEIVRTAVVSHNDPSTTDINDIIKKIDDYEWLDCVGSNLFLVVENENLLLSNEYNYSDSISSDNLHCRLGYVGIIDRESITPLGGVYVTHNNRLYTFLYGYDSPRLGIDEYRKISTQ